MAHLPREQLAPEPSVALARRQDLIAKVTLEVGEGGLRGGRGRVEPRPQSRHRRIVRRSVGGRQRLVDQVDDAGQLVDRGLGLEPPDRAAWSGADQRLAGGSRDRIHRLQASRDAR